MSLSREINSAKRAMLSKIVYVVQEKINNKEYRKFLKIYISKTFSWFVYISMLFIIQRKDVEIYFIVKVAF